MSDPSISVVMPCYNQPKLMVRAVYSVLEQTIASEVCVVVVSDGGTLKSQSEWMRVVSTFSNVTVLYTKNNGPGQARNTAIDWLLKTYPDIEYLFFLDADNHLEPTALETARRQLKASGRQWLYSDIQAFGIEGNTNSVSLYNPHIHLFRNYCDSGCLVDADLLRSGVRFNPDRREGFEDWGFWLTALEKGYLGAHSDDFGFRYRRRAASRFWDEERKKSVILDHMRARHRELYRFRSVKRLEHDHAPRFCVMKAGGSGWLFSDPFAPGKTCTVPEIKNRFWGFADRPDRHFFPPYTVIVHPAFFESGTLSPFRRDIFLRIDHELRQHPLVIGHVGCAQDAFRVTMTADMDDRIDHVVFVAARSDLVLECLLDRDFDRIHQLLTSSESRHWTYHVRESLDFKDETDLVRYGLLTHMSQVSDRRLAEQTRIRWNWKVPTVQCVLPDYADWTPDLDRYCLPDLQADERRTIGFVLKICDFGGAEKVIFNVAEQLAENGWQVNLFLYGADTAKAPMHQLRSFENVYFFDPSYQDDRDLPDWAGEQNYNGVPIPEENDPAYQNLGAVLSAMDVVVNASSWRFNALVSDLRQQGVVTATYQHVVDYTAVGQPTGHPYVALAFEHAYDLMITCSRALSHWLGAAGVPREKCCYVRNAPGFPMDEAVLQPESVPQNRPLRVLYLGRFDRQKGMDRIAQIYRATRGCFDWRVIGSPLIHDSNLSLESALPAIYDEDELREQYAWADVMLLLSDYEGVPLGILEAQAAGCVVISTDVGAVSEAITDGRDGFLVPPDNYIERTLDIMSRLDADRTFMTDIGAAARDRVARHPWSKNTRPLIRRLEELVASRRSANLSKN